MGQKDKLLKYISKLQVEEYIGLAKLLKVQLITKDESEEYIARDFAEVLEDIVVAFTATSRARRREILQLLKAATSKEDKI